MTFLTRFSPAQMGRILNQPPAYLKSRMTVPPWMADLLTLLRRQSLEHPYPFLCSYVSSSIGKPHLTSAVNGSLRSNAYRSVYETWRGQSSLTVPLSWSKRPSRLYDRLEQRPEMCLSVCSDWQVNFYIGVLCSPARLTDILADVEFRAYERKIARLELLLPRQFAICRSRWDMNGLGFAIFTALSLSLRTL